MEFVNNSIITLRIDIILLRLLRGFPLASECRGVTGIYDIYGCLKDIVPKYYGDIYLDPYPASYILDYFNYALGAAVLILAVGGRSYESNSVLTDEGVEPLAAILATAVESDLIWVGVSLPLDFLDLYH